MTSQAMRKNGGKTILVVDDEKDVREIVSEMIEDLGFSVCDVESGEAALDLVSRIPVDLVISDVKMNGMDGLSLAKLLRKQFPKLPLALMTSYPSDDVQAMLRDRRVDFLLQKPFQIQELQGMVLDLTAQL